MKQRFPSAAEREICTNTSVQGKKHLAELGGKGKEQQPSGFLVVSTCGTLEMVQFGVPAVSKALGWLSHHAQMGWICRLLHDLC